MFCPYCGHRISDDATFCMSCGNRISSQITSFRAVGEADDVRQQQNDFNAGAYTVDHFLNRNTDFQSQKSSVRQSEINELSSALSHFSKKETEFRQYDYAGRMVNHYARGARSALLIWGCIIISIGLTLFFAFVSDGEGAEVLPVLLPAFLIPGVLMIVGGILMKVSSRKKYAFYQQEYARLSQELTAHYTNYPNCPVGPEYTNPEVLATLIGILQSGRADTIKEGINLMLSGRI